MEELIPKRVPTLTDIMKLLSAAGEIPEYFNSKIINVGSVKVNYGLALWNIVSFIIFKTVSGYRIRFNILGIDRFAPSKKKVITYERLSVLEKRNLYNFLRKKYGFTIFYR